MVQTDEIRANRTRLDVLPSVMDFGLMTAFDRYLRGQSNLYPIHERLADDRLFADPAMLVSFLGNHDMARAIDRCGESPERYKLALFVLLTTRGIPQLLYGEEIGLRSVIIPGNPDAGNHEALRRDFPGGFPHGMDASGLPVPEDPEADQRSAFTAEGRTALENDFFNYTRSLLQLRKAHPALQTGTLTQLTPRWDGVWAWLRHTENETLLCVVNGGLRDLVIEPAYFDPLWSSIGNDRPETLRPLFGGTLQQTDAPMPLAALDVAVYAVER
jgi:glycosidase